MLKGHGDDSYLYDQKIIADFSTNVYPGGEPAGMKEYLFKNWKAVNKYPEAVAESLRKKIGTHFGLVPDNILVANGTTESIYLIAQAFSGEITSIAIPTFSEYEDACMMYGHHVAFIGWEDLSSNMRIYSELIFICNPNNPNGAHCNSLERIIKQNPNTVFVVDEAFIEFTEVDSLIPLIGKYNNLLILKSMTKYYAIPGLRLGYIVGSAVLIERLTRFKQPWSVNAIALSAGHFIFDNIHNISIPVKTILREKEAFVKALEELENIKTYPSSAHFFLCETLVGTATELKSFLIEKFGILIRDAGNFRGLGKRHFRVATLDSQQNQLLVKGISEWTKSY